MLSSGPAQARAIPGTIPHGGILIPKYGIFPVQAACSASLSCRSRVAVDLGNAGSGALFLQACRRQTSRNQSHASASARQPGPQDDGCKCDPGHHNLQHQPQSEPSNAQADSVGTAQADPLCQSHRGSEHRADAAPCGQQDPSPGCKQEADSSATESRVAHGRSGGLGATKGAGNHRLDGSSAGDGESRWPNLGSFAEPKATAPGQEGAGGVSEQVTGFATPYATASGPDATIDLHQRHQQPLQSGPSGQQPGGRRRQAQQQHPHRQPQQRQQDDGAPAGRERGASEQGRLQYPQHAPPPRNERQEAASVHAQAPEGQPQPYLNGTPVPDAADDGSSSSSSSSNGGSAVDLGSGGVDGVAGSPRVLPPLRLGFLGWAGLKAEPPTSSQEPGGKSAGPQQPRPSGNARRRRGGAGEASAQRRDERIRQLIVASKTLVQLRMVCQRHMPHMSAATAAIGLSRLAGLSAAITRLRKAQLRSDLDAEGRYQQPTDAAGAPLAEASSPPPSLAPLNTAADTRAGGPDLDGSASVPAAVAAVVEEGTAAGPYEASAGSSTVVDLCGSPGASSAAVVPSDSRHAAPSPAPPSTSATTSTACAPPYADTSIADSAAGDAGVGADDATARSAPSSTKGLMRRMLLHVAACVVGQWSGPGPGGALVSVHVRRPPSSPALPSLSRSSSRFAPPDHRARVAAIVLGALACGGYMPVKEDRQALYDIVQAARPDLFLATPSKLARIAASLPALRLRPSAAWLDHFCAVSRSKMYASRPEHLATMLWFLAKLGHHPGDLWLHTWCDHWFSQGSFAAPAVGSLCRALWGLHRLGFQPDAEWREACAAGVLATMTVALAGPVAAFAGAPGLRAGGTAGSQNVDEEEDGPVELYGSSEDLYGSSSEDEYDGAGGAGGEAVAAMVAAREAGGYPAREVASLLLWAVRLGAAPSPAGVEALLKKLQPQLHTLRRFHLMRLLLALAEGGYRPTGEFVAAVLACLQPKLASLSAKQLTQSLLAVSQLRYVPSQPWLIAFLKASRTQLRFYGPSHVTVTFQVFAAWHVRPPRPYLEDLHSYVDGLLPAFSTRGLATILNSMSCLGIKPQRRWLARALEVLVQSASKKSSTATHGTAVSGGGGGAVTARAAGAAEPPVPAYIAASQLPATPLQWNRYPGVTSGPFTQPPSRTSTSTPLPLPQQPQQPQGQGPAITAAVVMAVCSLRGVVHFDADAGQRAAVSGGSGGSSVEAAAGPASAVNTSMMTRSAEGATAAAAGASEAEALTPAEALVLLPYELWSAVKQVTDLCRELFDDMSASELTRLIQALDRIHFYPGRDFLDEHSRAVARLGWQLQPSEKAAVAQCYSHLVAVAPLMAAESRRQSELRMARAAVLMGSEAGLQ